MTFIMDGFHNLLEVKHVPQLFALCCLECVLLLGFQPVRGKIYVCI